MPEALQRPFGMFLEASLSAAVLALIVLVIQVTLRKRLSPAWRFALWTPVLLRLLIPVLPESSLSLFNLPRWIAGWNPPEIVVVQSQRPEGHLLFEFNAPFEEGTVAAPQFIQANAAPDWRSIAAGVWLGGVVVLLARLGFGALWISIQIRRAGTAAPPSVQKVLSEAAALFEGRSRPKLVEAKFVESPALFGLFRPTLLVPPHLSTSLSGAEMRHVFLHELAHLKRRDLLLNWLMALAQAVHWFNPFVWLVFRRMRLERELACDEMALRVSSEPDPKPYGATILRLLEGVGPRPALSTLVGIAEEKQTATQRLKQIAAFKAGRRRYWMALPILAAVIVVGLTNAQAPMEKEIIPTIEEEAAAPIDKVSAAILIDDARLLIELAKFDEAESKLEDALKANPESRDAHYYLELLKERGNTVEARRRAQALQQSTGVSPLPSQLPIPDQLPSANPYASSNRTHESPERREILRKLNEIRLEKYEVDGVPLFEVVKDLARIAREKDSRKIGVNFIISEFTSAEFQALPKVTDFKITIDPPLRDVRLIDVLNAIVHVAVPPNGDRTAGLKYSIEDYAVVFSYHNPEADRLHTRTYKLDPRNFLSNVRDADPRGFDPVFGNLGEGLKEPDSATIQNSVRDFFIAAGIDFLTNNVTRAGRGPQKAIYFNHENGVLYVRATMQDMDLIETALQMLNTPPAQVTLETGFVKLNGKQDLEEALKLLGFTQGNIHSVLTTRAFKQLKDELKEDGRFEMRQGPKVTTLSGRAARVSIESEKAEENVGVDIRCDVERDTVLRIWASNYNPTTNKRGDVYSGKLYDGQTYFFFPQLDEKSSQPAHITFITATVIDPAGNRVNTPDDFPLQAERTPAQD